METFDLSPESRNRPAIIKFFQIFLGIISIITAIAWLFILLSKGDSGLSVWITILFLTAFGLYMILSGLGKDTRYIGLSDELIVLKQNTFLPPEKILINDLEKIIIHPLSIEFYAKGNKVSRLRFGISYPEIIGPVKRRIEDKAGQHSIAVEIVEDNI